MFKDRKGGSILPQEEVYLIPDGDEGYPPSKKASMGGRRPKIDDEPAEMYVVPMEFPMSPGADRRSLKDRTFSKLGKGSLRGSIFSLSASAVGAGVLSLPYVLKLCGWA